MIIMRAVTDAAILISDFQTIEEATLYEEDYRPVVNEQKSIR